MHGAPHRRHRRAFAGPDFPLRRALRHEHFHAGNGFDAAARRKLQKLRFARAINGVKYQPQFNSSVERRLLDIGMHAHGSGVDDGVEEFRRKRVRRSLAADGRASDFAFSCGAPKRKRPPGLGEGESDRASGATRANNQYAAVLQGDARLERVQHADIVGVVAVEFATAAHDHCVHGADFCGEGIAAVEMAQDGSLCGMVTLEALDAEGLNGAEKSRRSRTSITPCSPSCSTTSSRTHANIAILDRQFECGLAPAKMVSRYPWKTAVTASIRKTCPTSSTRSIARKVSDDSVTPGWDWASPSPGIASVFAAMIVVESDKSGCRFTLHFPETRGAKCSLDPRSTNSCR